MILQYTGTCLWSRQSETPGGLNPRMVCTSQCNHLSVNINGCTEIVTESFWISQLDDFCIADSLLQIIHLFSSLDVSRLSGFPLIDKVGLSLLQIKQGAFCSCTKARSHAVTCDTEYIIVYTVNSRIIGTFQDHGIKQFKNWYAITHTHWYTIFIYKKFTKTIE